MKFKENLRRFREEAGYKQAKEFAKVANIPYPSYSAYENGRWPNETNLTKIARALKISIDDLLGYDPEQPDEMQKIRQELESAGFVIQKTHPIGPLPPRGFENLGPDWSIYYGESEFPIIVNERTLIALYQNYLSSNTLKKNVKAAKKAAFTEVLLEYLNVGRGTKLTKLPEIK